MIAARQFPGRPGWADYASVLRSIIDQPGIMAREIAERHGIRGDAAHHIVRMMLWLKLIHPCVWHTVPRCSAVPGWGFGADGAVPRPNEAATYRPMRPRSELIMLAHIVRELQAGRYCYQGLALATGASANRLSSLLKVMHRDLRMVYVAKFDRRRRLGGMRGGTPAAMYSFGVDREDVPRPKPEPSAVSERRYRDRKAAAARAVIEDQQRQAARRQFLAANSSIFNLAQYA